MPEIIEIPEEIVEQAKEVNVLEDSWSSKIDEMNAANDEKIKEQIQQEANQILEEKEQKSNALGERIAKYFGLEYKSASDFSNRVNNPVANDPITKALDKTVLDFRNDVLKDEIINIQESVGESDKTIENSPKTQEALWKKYGKAAGMLIFLAGAIAGVTYGLLAAIAASLSGCYFNDICKGTSTRICSSKVCSCASENTIPGECDLASLPPRPRCKLSCNGAKIFKGDKSEANYVKYYTYKNVSAVDVLNNLVEVAEQIAKDVNPSNIAKKIKKLLINGLKLAGISLAITIIIVIIYKLVMSAKKQ